MRVNTIFALFRRSPDAKHGKNGRVIGMIWQSARILSLALSDGLSRWLTSAIFGEFTDALSSKRLAHFPKYWDEQKDGLSPPWAAENHWLHPADRLWVQTVQKLNFEQGR